MEEESKVEGAFLYIFPSGGRYKIGKREKEGERRERFGDERKRKGEEEEGGGRGKVRVRNWIKEAEKFIRKGHDRMRAGVEKI